MKRTIPLAALGACLAIGAAAGGVTIANSSDSPEIVKAPKAAIALLSAPAASSDASLFASPLGRTLAEQGDYEIDVASARVVDTGGLSVWVAANDKKDVCSAIEVDGALALNCAPSSVVATNGLFSTALGAPGKDGSATVVGVVPDGITEVRFNGASMPARVEQNVVVATLAKAPSGATLVGDDAATAVKFGGDDVR